MLGDSYSREEMKMSYSKDSISSQEIEYEMCLPTFYQKSNQYEKKESGYLLKMINQETDSLLS